MLAAVRLSPNADSILAAVRLSPNAADVQVPE